MCVDALYRQRGRRRQVIVENSAKVFIGNRSLPYVTTGPTVDGWQYAKWHHQHHRDILWFRRCHLASPLPQESDAVVYRVPHGISTATENHMATHTKKGKDLR